MSTLTCVIPVYNAERFLEETLLSVAAQRRLPDRLIIQDNCSTDATPRIVSDFQARFPGVRCEWRPNEKNVGALGNFNRSLAYANETDFLHLLSADDLIAPEFFERVVPPIEGVKGRALAYSHLQFIDQSGRKLPPIRENTRRQPVEVGKRQFLENQSELNHLYCQSVILKTARLPAPTFFREDWLQAADVVFFSEWALQSEKIVEVPEPLCLYRMHSQSATGGNILNLQAWVMEEWRAMQTVAKMIPPAAFADWLGAHRRRCIFAARSKVKMQTMCSNHPDYARQIGSAALQTVGRLHWWLGNMAVVIRDFLQSFRRDRQLDKNQSMVS
jgi:glycosyltransferase involved in cell wall biosynthesis